MNEATASAPESSATPHFRRPNFHNIAPYFLVKGAPQFIDFLVAAFDGTERSRVRAPTATSCTPKSPSAIPSSNSAMPTSNIPRAQ